MNKNLITKTLDGRIFNVNGPYIEIAFQKSSSNNYYLEVIETKKSSIYMHFYNELLNVNLHNYLFADLIKTEFELDIYE